jgi:hypothetical protein
MIYPYVSLEKGGRHIERGPKYSGGVRMMQPAKGFIPSSRLTLHQHSAFQRQDWTVLSATGFLGRKSRRCKKVRGERRDAKVGAAARTLAVKLTRSAAAMTKRLILDSPDRAFFTRAIQSGTD